MWRASEWLMRFDAAGVERRRTRARRWGVMRADEQRQRRRWQHSQCRAAQEAAAAAAAAPSAAEDAAVVSSRSSAAPERPRPCCLSLRPPVKSARWIYDLRNSGGSERTGKAAVREMSVAGKQQPEVIERPASLPVPTSASRRSGSIPSHSRTWDLPLTCYFSSLTHTNIIFFKNLNMQETHFELKFEHISNFRYGALRQ